MSVWTILDNVIIPQVVTENIKHNCGHCKMHQKSLSIVLFLNVSIFIFYFYLLCISVVNVRMHENPEKSFDNT